jgi:hypothetical protein
MKQKITTIALFLNGAASALRVKDNLSDLQKAIVSPIEVPKGKLTPVESIGDTAR